MAMGYPGYPHWYQRAISTQDPRFPQDAAAAGGRGGSEGGRGQEARQGNPALGNGSWTCHAMMSHHGSKFFIV